MSMIAFPDVAHFFVLREFLILPIVPPVMFLTDSYPLINVCPISICDSRLAGG